MKFLSFLPIKKYNQYHFEFYLQKLLKEYFESSINYLNDIIIIYLFLCMYVKLLKTLPLGL